MNQLEVTRYLGMATGIFFRPFRTLTELFEAVRDIGRRNSFRLAFTAFLVGNASMVLGGMLMNPSGSWERPAVLLLHLTYRLLASFVAGLMMASVFYLLIYLFSGEESVIPQIDKLICIYFTTDIVFAPLLPLSILLFSFGELTGVFYGLFSFLVMLISILLKIKAISLTASVSKGKSAFLFLTPVLILIAFIILTLSYSAIFFSRMFS